MSRPKDMDPQFRQRDAIGSRSTYADLPENEIPSRILRTATAFIGAIVEPIRRLIGRVTRSGRR